MSSQSLHLNIPEPMYRWLKERAERSNRSVEDEAVELLAAAVPVAEEAPAVGTEAWGRMNQRRAELIRKRNREGLSPDEQAEYGRLQRLSGAALEEAFPRPALDDERAGAST